MAIRKSVTKKPAVPAPAVTTTPVRNTVVPPKAPVAAPAKKIVTQDQIALRAYEIWKSGKGGSEYDNWVRAEQELRGI